MVGAAINNETFVVYANRPGPFFSGHSGVFGPNGDLLATAGAEEQMIETVIDLEDARRWRKEEPIFPHRRPLLYREIADAHRAELPGRGKGKKRQDLVMVSGGRR
jgi:predicted amidohydrolase